MAEQKRMTDENLYIETISPTTQPAARRRGGYLYVAVFTSGMTTLAVELTASRLLGSVFGTSNLVWANVIGLMLLYLTVGYFIGGRWADRSPYRTTFYRILVWAAFLSALIPLAARPVLSAAANAVYDVDAGLAIGSFASVLVLFAIPVTLLGTVSPFAIRLAVTDIAAAGKTAGRIYAISTLGSLIGTFLPVVLIIPVLGTFGTFLLFASILYVVGLGGLWSQHGVGALRWLWMPAVIAVLSALTLSGPLRAAAPNASILYESESAYNYIQVQEDADGYRYLYLNEGQGVHSQWHPEIYIYGRTWSFFLIAPYFNAPPFTPEDIDAVAVIGLAGGTIARQYTHIYGDVPIDGVEIDGRIVAAGAEFFDMNADALPNLTVHVEDGRYILNQLNGDYSVIAVDAYRPPYIPWHMTTVEFFREARAQLAEDGVVAINVGRTDTDRRLVDALTATLLQVFPTVHALDVPFSFNTILVATRQPTLSSDLQTNLDALPAAAPQPLRDILALGTSALVPTHPSELVFTDDRAPVETLVDSLVLNFLFSGGIDQLRPVE
ncbi:MAG: spermine synthase [Chloroflexi bacterium]|nr:spermine synthase [Chloroflexota bacterium]